jgi:hypothetical protein
MARPHHLLGVAAGVACVCFLALVGTQRHTGNPIDALTLDFAPMTTSPRRLGRARTHPRTHPRTRLAATPISAVDVQAAHVRCAIQSLQGGVHPDGGHCGCATAGGCPPTKVVNSIPSDFPDPRFSASGAQYNENGAGWTTSGVLDNSGYAAGDIERWPISDKPGHVREINGDAPEAGGEPKGLFSSIGTHCGCTICPCRGDDDLDSVSNGEWTWPVQAVRTKPPAAVGGASSRAKKGGKKGGKKGKSCPDCQYVAKVKPITERYIATVLPTEESSSSSSSSSSSHTEKTVVKFKTKYVPVYNTVYKERTVYVPVYDDPFWNPEADGRVAGEGIGLPEASPYGALPYKTGAWYEWGQKRHNMLDALGGTLDTDRDVDQPADLGVWWGDSLPSGKMVSSLSDSDSF